MRAHRAGPPVGPGLAWAGQRLDVYLRSVLGEVERVVGCADGVLMAYDPDVLLPTSAVSLSPRDLPWMLRACWNEQVEPDLLKFRDLARAPAHLGVADLLGVMRQIGALPGS